MPLESASPASPSRFKAILGEASPPQPRRPKSASLAEPAADAFVCQYKCVVPCLYVCLGPLSHLAQGPSYEVCYPKVSAVPTRRRSGVGRGHFTGISDLGFEVKHGGSTFSSALVLPILAGQGPVVRSCRTSSPDSLVWQGRG